MEFELNCNADVIRNDAELERFIEMLLALDEVEKPYENFVHLYQSFTYQ